MYLVDIVGVLVVARHSRQFVVTASVDHMDFVEPVMIGELLVLRASVNRAFRSSMEVGVKVWAENMRTAYNRHVASAYLTFVALDKDRNSIPVPPLVAESDDEKRRYAEAGQRRDYRLQHRLRRDGKS